MGNTVGCLFFSYGLTSTVAPSGTAEALEVATNDSARFPIMDKSVHTEIENYHPKARQQMQPFTFQVDRQGSTLTIYGNDKAHAIKRFQQMNPEVVFILLTK